MTSKVKGFAQRILVTASDPMTVAKTIIQQLGGNKFIAMTGANQFMAIGGKSTSGKQLNPGVGFYIGRNDKQVNYVRITLTPMDEYDMEFMKAPRSARGAAIKLIKKVEGAPVENMREIFTRYTGMETSLGTMTGPPSNANPGKPILPPEKPAAAPPAAKHPPMPKGGPAPAAGKAPAGKAAAAEPPAKGGKPPKPATARFYEKAIKVTPGIAQAFFQWGISEGMMIALVEDKYVLCSDKATFDYMLYANGRSMTQKHLSVVPYSQVLNEMRA